MEKQKTSVIALSKHPFSYILTLLIFGLLISYVYARWDEISTWLTLRPESLIAIIALVYLSVMIGGTLNQILLSHFGLKLPCKEWIPITCVVTALNTILPSGSGAAARAVYLKKNYGFAITDSTSGFLFSNMVSILVNALFGLGLTLTLVNLSERNSHIFTLAFSAISLMAMLIIFLPSFQFFRKFQNKPSRQKTEPNGNVNTLDAGIRRSDEHSVTHRFLGFGRRFLEIVNDVNKGFKSLNTHIIIIVQISFLTLLNTLLYGVRIYLAFWCISQPVSITYCLIAGVLASLSLAFSITPGGLGVREGLLIVAGVAFGISFEHTLVAATIERVVTTASSWAVVPTCLHRLKLKL